MKNGKNPEYILIVTDKDAIALKIQKTLGDGFLYERTSSVAEALSSITFHIPGLIIADFDLPDISGYELLKAIRRSIKTRLIPFITLTVKDSPKKRIQAIEYGADAFLPYGFIPEELQAIVVARLNRFKEFYLLSITDELTRLYNRREFIKKFNTEIADSSNSYISLAILDIDFFKKVNDTYGHQVGDNVLMRLAECLKKRSSDSFFPARFGGEEFVILFPGLNAEQAKENLQGLLNDFSAVEFNANNIRFIVTFSAGVAEYPSMAVNASELLSRADQALYAAKQEGRNKVYTFSPIMARNDIFWEHMKSKREIFVNEKGHDVTTRLPYLPQLLEVISNLDFEANSIGVMVVDVHPLNNLEDWIGFKNIGYDIENINMIISKACELIFPSDTYIGISDFFSFEFIVMFPSVVDFSFNLEKFQNVCRDIVKVINTNLKNYGLEISFASSVVVLDKINPGKILKEIEKIIAAKKRISGKLQAFEGIVKAFRKIGPQFKLEKYLQLKNYYHLDTLENAFQYFSLTEPFDKMNIFGLVLQSSIKNLDDFSKLLKDQNAAYRSRLESPLLYPWINAIELKSYCAALRENFPEKDIIVLINENNLLTLLENNEMISYLNSLPTGMGIGVDNCYIGNDILSYLSSVNFRLLLFSDNITRNLHFFKDRIKIISGLKGFLDQIDIPCVAKNILQEEEYQILADLGFKYFSGEFIKEFSTKK